MSDFLRSWSGVHWVRFVLVAPRSVGLGSLLLRSAADAMTGGSLSTPHN